MRLQRTRWRLSGRPAASAETAEDAQAAHTASTPPTAFPPRIRLIRAGVGLGLLVLAWIGAMAMYVLVRAAIALPSRRPLLMLLAPRIAEGLGACLLVIVVTALLLVGAFALSLAVHPNDPEVGPLPEPTASEE